MNDETKPKPGLGVDLEALPAGNKATERAERCDRCEAGHFPRTGVIGECRHAPPLAFPLMQQTPTGAMPVANSIWPPVKRDQFCVTGFKLKEGAKH